VRRCSPTVFRQARVEQAQLAVELAMFFVGEETIPLPNEVIFATQRQQAETNGRQARRLQRGIRPFAGFDLLAVDVTSKFSCDTGLSRSLHFTGHPIMKLAILIGIYAASMIASGVAFAMIL
jgi:hypothetical protein